MRKWLARSRHFLAKHGIDLRPLTHAPTGGYGGFSLTWRQPEQRNLRGTVCQVSHARGDAVFFVENERDFIQRYHLKGAFYEESELALISEHAKGGTFLDIGANVGNHAVFAGRFLGFERVFAVEPNPQTAQILALNLRLNGMFDSSEIARVGLSDEPMQARIILPLDNNLGAARVGMQGRDGEEIELVCGDELFKDERIDFIKMDIEGHELRALRGLQTTLRRDKPTVFVEVERENFSEVRMLMSDLGYRLKDDLRFANDRSNQLFIHEGS